MLRWFCLAACLYLMFSAATAHAQQVTLRPRIEASGPAVTLGDVFDGAGEASNRAIAPAPPAGQVGTLQIAVLYAAASAAGLEWTPPPGVNSVPVVRPGGARATLPATSGRGSVADAAVRRGETITLVYQTPGMSLSVRARALEDAAIGQSIRLQNTTSDRTIDAIVTGPGAAQVIQ
ncbi:MAG: flagellar basal body P-ring formation chaperone FlgA [Hyphomonadaceae bacterium]